MPIGGQTQHAGYSVRTKRQAEVQADWNADRAQWCFVEVYIGTVKPMGFVDVFQPAQTSADYFVYKEFEKGPAVAQIWSVEEAPPLQGWMPCAKRLVSFTISGTGFETGAYGESSFRLRLCEYQILQPHKRQHGFAERLRRIALTPATSYLSLCFREPQSKADSGFYPSAPLERRSAVPVFLAEPEAIRAMAEAEDEHAARAEAEIADSHVSHRIIHDDFDES